jgi:hypothetical protein
MKNCKAKMAPMGLIDGWMDGAAKPSSSIQLYAQLEMPIIYPF